MASGALRSTAGAAWVLLCAIACTAPRTPVVDGRVATPSCARGTFAAEVQRLIPPLEPLRSITLVPAGSIAADVEPGCVVPFRTEPDERLLDAGLVVGKTVRRSDPSAKPVVVGRGRLRVGRRAMRLELHDDAGDPVLALSIEGARASLREKGAPPFDGDVRLDGDEPLPLPLDALVAALDRCDDDVRLGRTPDGNVIEARRGSIPLWRTRWVDDRAASIVDTSIACGPDDARAVWRSAVGELLPTFAVASVRSDRVLVIVRHGSTPRADDVLVQAAPGLAP